LYRKKFTYFTKPIRNELTALFQLHRCVKWRIFVSVIIFDLVNEYYKCIDFENALVAFIFRVCCQTSLYKNPR
jgi:hypothetical protein